MVSKTLSYDIPVYIIDFFNIFSDFREIKYKQSNIDFHNIKHANKSQDTQDFFKLFFSRYIQYANIPKYSRFIFIMKKLNGYQSILEDIVATYRNFNMKLMIIEEKYKDDVLDKNKDDFLCQYIFHVMQKNNNVILVSNDKYRDRRLYVQRFDFDIALITIKWDKLRQALEKMSLKYQVNRNLCSNLIHQKYQRCTIPKHKLTSIL